MVKAVIFDCFGVLTTDSWKEFVGTLPMEKRHEARDLNHAFGSAAIDKAQFLKAIVELTGRQPEDIDSMLDNEMYKNTELLDYIAQLKPKYKIGLLSNVASNWIRDRFLTPEEQALFDEFILSYEVGLTKPDKEIYKLSAECLGTEISECLLVDDVEYYGQAAQELGMKFVLYKNFGQAKAEIEAALADSKS